MNTKRRDDWVQRALAAGLVTLTALSTIGCATSKAGQPDMIATANNPDPKNLPTLGVWQRGKETLVSATFPKVPGFACDSWCYESAVDFVGARALDGGRLELRHRLHKPKHVILVTTVTPEPDAVEFAARAEVDAQASGRRLPESLLVPNLCWQLRRAETFKSAPDPYPEFVKRCFIFTPKGRTFLDKTVRRNIPCRPADHEYNNPPWVQMYVGVWQEIPKVTPKSWADYSTDRYTTTVIGAVSRDGKHLAALANDSAALMCQAWHDCLHNNPQWLPAGAPPQNQVWRVKFYVMANDPDRLLTRVAEDFPNAKHAYQTQGIANRLPIFRDQAAARMTFSMSWASGRYTDFAAWRTAGRAKVIECMLKPPPPAPFEPTVIAEQDRGGYVARKVTLNITADSRVLAYMLAPKGKGPFPAVLLLHDHGAKFDIGKEKVIRPWDVDAKRLASANAWVEQCYGGRFIGDELARRGYVCFCTDALNWSDRGGAGYEGQQSLASNLFHLGMSLAGVIAHEDLRAAEFLATQPEVDPKRVAAMGLSMGSFRAWQVSALSDRIAAGVAVCWMATVKGLMAPGNNQARGQSAFTMTHPDLFNHLDYPDVASLACPKPMLFYNGTQDALFPVPSVQAAYARMRQVWESQGAADRLVTKLWDVPHEFNRTMQDEAFAWLDRQFDVKSSDR